MNYLYIDTPLEFLQISSLSLSLVRFTTRDKFPCRHKAYDICTNPACFSDCDKWLYSEKQDESVIHFSRASEPCEA